MKLRIITDHPIATAYAEHFDRDSDHSLCISRFSNPQFNRRLYELKPGTLIIADLGCSVGAFVSDCIRDGHIAIGIEGTDWYLRHIGKTKQWPTDPTVCIRDKTFQVDDYSEWPRFPGSFFTADITQPFRLENYDGTYVGFDVVTAWEVMEHLAPEGVAQMLQNVRSMLNSDGLFICSISEQKGQFHKTVRPPGWWDSAFAAAGLVLRPDLLGHFGQEWIRGPKQHAPQSFHRIAQRITSV